MESGEGGVEVELNNLQSIFTRFYIAEYGNEMKRKKSEQIPERKRRKNSGGAESKFRRNGH